MKKKQLTALFLALILSFNMTGGLYAEDSSADPDDGFEDVTAGVTGSVGEVGGDTGDDLGSSTMGGSGDVSEDTGSPEGDDLGGTTGTTGSVGNAAGNTDPEPVKLTGSLFGTDCYSEYTSFDRAFDDDVTTFYDGMDCAPIEKNKLYIGMKLDGTAQLTSVRFFPRIYINYDVEQQGLIPSSGTAGFYGDDWDEHHNNLFDGNPDTMWCGEYTDGLYSEWYAAEPVNVTGYALCLPSDVGAYPERTPSEWTLYGSNTEGSGWEVIDSVSSGSGMLENAYEVHVFEADRPGTYQYFRLEISALHGMTNDGQYNTSMFSLAGIELIDGENYVASEEYFRCDSERIGGMLIEGSVNGVNWEPLYTFPEQEYRLGYYEITDEMLEPAADLYAFRHFRFRHPDSGHLEAAEVELYGITEHSLNIYDITNKKPTSIIEGTLLNSIKGTHTFGSDSFSNGCKYEKAFDGNTGTYYDARITGPYMTLGIDLDVPVQLTGVRIHPRVYGREEPDGCDVTVISSNTGTEEAAAENLFDDNVYTKWKGDFNGTAEVVWEEKAPITVSAYCMANTSNVSAWPEQIPITWTLWGSGDNGATWNMIDHRENEPALVSEFYREHVFQIPGNAQAYQTYKLTIEDINRITAGGDYEAGTFGLSQFELYEGEDWQDHADYFWTDFYRLEGLVVEGSNDGIDWRELYVFEDIDYQPEYYAVNSELLLPLAGEYAFSEFRIRHKDFNHLEIAELEFYGIADSGLEKYPSTGVMFEGIPAGSVNLNFETLTKTFGTDPYSVESTYDKAFDLDPETFYDALHTNPRMEVGIEVYKPAQLTGLRIYPRNYGIAPEIKEIEGCHNLFDYDPTTVRIADFDENGRVTVIWETPDEVIVTGYMLTNSDAAPDMPEQIPTSWALYGLNENDEWILIDRREGDTSLTTDQYIYPSEETGFHVPYVIDCEDQTRVFDTFKLEITGVYGLKTDGTEDYTKAALSGIDLLGYSDVREYTEDAWYTDNPQRIPGLAVEGSTDGVLWETLYVFENRYYSAQYHTITADELADAASLYSFRKFRLRHTELGGDHHLQMAEIEFYGYADSGLPEYRTAEWIKDKDYVVIEEIAPDQTADLYSEAYPASVAEGWPEAASGELLKGTVIAGYNGENHCWGNSPCNAAAAFDGNVYSFFDPFDDYGASYAGMILEGDYKLSEVRIKPRNEWADNIVNCAVQGSYDGIEWNDVVRITGVDSAPAGMSYHCFTPESNEDYIRIYADNGYEDCDLSVCWVSDEAYPIYRYVTLGGSHAYVAEIELYGNEYHETWTKNEDYVILEEVAPDELGDLYGSSYPGSLDWDWPQVTTGELLKGTVIAGYDGEKHCWSNSPDNAAKAFDGDTSTFFDPFNATEESYVGMMLDEKYELTEVRLMPRENWLGRMSGGAVQGSNDGIHWDNIVYITGVNEAPVGYDYHCFTPETNEEYTAVYADYGVDEPDLSVYWCGSGAYSIYRYVNLEYVHGDIAEIELYGIPTEICEHEMTYVEGCDKTCTADGLRSHWLCGICGRMFENENGTGQIFYAVIPASHTENGIWSSDSESHWMQCSDCGERVNETFGEHFHENNSIPVVRCDTCGFMMSTADRIEWEENLDYVVIPAEDSENYPNSVNEGWPDIRNDKVELLTGTVAAGWNGIQHNWIKEDGENPDTAAMAFDGDIHTCFDPYEASINSWCGLILEDKYELTEVRIKPREGWLERMAGGAIQGSNDGLNWTTIVYLTDVYESPAGFEYHCFTPETNTEYTDRYIDCNTAQPDLSQYWLSGGAYRMFRYVNLEKIHGNIGEIELYGIREEIHVHAMTWVAEKAPTCTDAGNTAHYRCTSCGLAYKDEAGTLPVDAVVIAAPGHRITAVEAKEATCTEQGRTAHWKCTVCGARFADAEGTIPMTANTTIPALGHLWSGWTITEDTAEQHCERTGCSASENKTVARVTVPVTNENTENVTESNHVDVNVIGDASEAVVVIDSTSLEKTLESLGASESEESTAAAAGNVTIDVASAISSTGAEEAEIKQVSIPTASVAQVASAAADEKNDTTGLEIKLTTGTVVFNAESLNAIAEANSEAANVELKIEKIAADDSTSVAQAVESTMATDKAKDTLGEMEDDEEIEILDAVDLTAGSVSGFGKNGFAVITIPFELKYGLNPDGLSVTYIHDNGSVEVIPAEYSNGSLTFTVAHFSVYLMTWSEPKYTVTVPASGYGDAEKVNTSMILRDEDGNVAAKAGFKGHDGYAKLRDIPEGEYTLEVSKPNHYSRTIRISVNSSFETEKISLRLVGDADNNGSLEDELAWMQIYFSTGRLPEFIGSLDDILRFIDVDSDGAFTRRDVMIYARHIAGWSEYQSLPKTIRKG